MNTTTAPAFTVVQPTNHWRILAGWYYRDTWVRLDDGTLDLWGIPTARVGSPDAP